MKITITVELVPSQVTCAWCQVVIRTGTLPISHGMCPTCVVRFTEPDPRD